MKSLYLILPLIFCTPGFAGELADMHNTRDTDAATNQGSEFGIERSICYGSCPAYTFIVQNDGTVRYTGTAHVTRKGVFTGKIDVKVFNTVAQAIKDANVMDLEDAYTIPVTDMPTVYTIVVESGKRKLISNYGGAGPKSLETIERLIDGLLAQVQWNEPVELRKRP